jgi:hypothetical protein
MTIALIDNRGEGEGTLDQLPRSLFVCGAMRFVIEL